MPRYRLLRPAEIDGAILPQGTVIERPKDWQGPMMTVSPNRTFRPDDMKDVPAYEEIKDTQGAE